MILWTDWTACAKRHPSDETIRDAQLDRLHSLADVSAILGTAEDNVRYRGRIVQMHEAEIRQAPSTRGVDRLLSSRRALARLHFSLGHREQAGSLFAKNCQLLENLPSGCEVFNTPVERLKADIDFKVCYGGTVSPLGRETVKPGPHFWGRYRSYGL